MEDKETLYARWLSGEITEKELAVLGEDGSLEDLERIARTSKRWHLPKYDTTEGLKKYHAKYTAKAAPVRRLNWRWVSGIAASVLFLVFANLYFKKDVSVILADHGANEQVKLQDGSTVIVNDGSSITYNNENWTTDRSVNLKGEAFFKVEKGSTFLVNTKNGSVEVLGTQFNVRESGTNLYVECYEGSVQVRSANQTMVLVKNESVNVVDHQMTAKQRIIHTSPLWSDGISRFYDEKINDVFKEVERQYDVTIQAPNLDKLFTGGFMHDDLEQTLLNICKPFDLTYVITQDTRVITIEENSK